ncbi:hypothetical protein [Denitratisoma oestradiolicum]|uniref:Uncharacterized protein n=1 Tax=Denitratisoma oestradiolicum TaxID=311182 RepID=A0A6S6Y5E7_9PROT|nr:hypothetical protein [Denitratisoma oestradiolicum]TWO81692.1 hypothetical protein CBW56_03000 [Denitratisoma oestradiolicum]CAB1370640.1 conserved protein of unknown function [Denitratisoma oestradiolicum]
MSEISKPVTARSLSHALVLGMLLIVVDGLVLNQGGIALLVMLWLLLVGMPRTLLARKYAVQRRRRLSGQGICCAAALLVLAMNYANNQLARSRAENLVAAVETFHRDQQRYPHRLDELVPRYLSRLPLAKYTLMFNEFRYIPGEQDPELLYVELPPFGRPVYSFRRKEWGYLD